MSRGSQWFRRFAEGTARQSGRPGAFLLAAAMVIVWGVTGPVFHFSETWQLVINTGTTIVTFLMVFLIQNSQNRDSVALQIKLDELIRATSAHDGLLAVEDLDEEALDRVRQQYRAIALRRAEECKDGLTGAKARAARRSDDASAEVRAIERELEAGHTVDAVTTHKPETAQANAGTVTASGTKATVAASGS